MTVEAQTEPPIEIEPRDWQEILGYIRSLEEKVMQHAAQVAALEVRLTRDEADRDRADLMAMGYVWGGPGGEAEEIDRAVCAETSCPACGHHGLGYEPWMQPHPTTGRRPSYRAFAVCPKCKHREEM